MESQCVSLMRRHLFSKKLELGRMLEDDCHEVARSWDQMN